MGKRVMILAGGTGGHVYPALAVAQRLLAQGHEVIWMGTRRGLEARVVPAAAIAIEWLSVSGVRGKGWRSKLHAPFMLLKALTQAASILRRVRPDVVLGMGGFVSGPGGLMARVLGIPLILHEQNRVPGTTNRLLARWANGVLEAFPGSFPSATGARCTGNPLRDEIAALALRPPREPADEPLKILIVGGSLGAQVLNRTLPPALAVIGQPCLIRHQTGEAMRKETEALYAEAGLEAKVDAFVEDMAAAYAWADLAVCRSGAMTVSELAAAGLPAILVPYPHAIDDHQTANAKYLADAGAAVVMAQSELTSQTLARTIKNVLTPPSRLAEMADRARSKACPDATETVAAICIDNARTPRLQKRIP
ncbi:MAG: undecaprenyldiphospho-muramoylpentapeptide beta-N-acetylglucosaminyltransferase [Methylococcaceae bacterium]|jgi:UDP-N-acetylglucosamine--N-acetylmuramyl-(pentapeptide) pyrophosphoryl-undecaprenol N-acetylglucosamine transferase